MSVTFARFPEVPSELEAESRAWLAGPNGQLRGSGGLRSRGLLLREDDSLISARPRRNEVVDLARAGCCWDARGDHLGQRSSDEVSAGGVR
jgi:hypothetical protein